MEKLFRMAEFGLKGNTKFSGRDREVWRVSEEESIKILRNNFKIYQRNLVELIEKERNPYKKSLLENELKIEEEKERLFLEEHWEV